MRQTSQKAQTNSFPLWHSSTIPTWESQRCSGKYNQRLCLGLFGWLPDTSVWNPRETFWSISDLFVSSKSKSLVNQSCKLSKQTRAHRSTHLSTPTHKKHTHTWARAPTHKNTDIYKKHRCTSKFQFGSIAGFSQSKINSDQSTVSFKNKTRRRLFWVVAHLTNAFIWRFNVRVNANNGDFHYKVWAEHWQLRNFYKNFDENLLAAKTGWDFDTRPLSEESP